MKLQDVDHRALRHLLGNRCYTSGVLAIDANTNDVQTTAAVVYTVKGILYSLAAIAAIDLSGLGGLPDDALATGYTQIFGLEASTDASTVTVVYGEQVLTADITSGARELDWPIASSDAHTIFGCVKVVNATGSNFTFGTTGLDTSGITDTYYNMSVSSF